jgi:hypothetical protein
MKKLFCIAIFATLTNFFIAHYSLAIYLGPAQCSDNTTNCGYIADVPLLDSCSMSGPDIYAGNRILGGQVCYTIGGQDNGGYYMIGTGEPNNNTPTYSFSSLNMTTPWNWTYSKSQNMFNYFGGSSIPTGVFQGEGPYYNLKFFDPVPVRVSFNQPPDDSGMLRIGSNYVYWTGCNVPPTDVFNSNCPSNNFVGSTSFNARPGDSVSFQITNHLRPNNGFSIWGGGSVQVTFGNLTVCYTQTYFDFFCGSPGCSGRPNYIPTAPGVCSPESQPKPKLDVIWQDTGTPNKTININQGDQIPSQTFVVRNIGERGSIMKVRCGEPSQPWVSVSYCPSGIDIIASNIDLKNSINNILSYLSNILIK